MTVNTMPYHPEIVFLTPSQQDLDRLHIAADAAYSQIQAHGLRHDQSAAFDYMAQTGQETFGTDPSFALAQDLSRFVLGNTPHQVMVVQMPAPKDLPPTPNFYPGPEDNPVMPFDVHRGLLLGAINHEAYGYTSQQPGNIINNVVAIPGMTGTKGVSANTAHALDLHTEDASYNKDGGIVPGGKILTRAHDASPDLLTLHFLRNEHGIPTVVSAPDLSKLSPQARETLSKPYFVNLTNASQGGAENDIHVPISVLYGDADRPAMRANTSALVLAENLSPKERAAAEAAKREFLELLEQSTAHLPSAPGDLVLIRNKHVAHGRAEYPKTMTDADKYGPTARWQRRVVAVQNDNRPLQQRFEVASRIIDPKKLDFHIRNHS